MFNSYVQTPPTYPEFDESKEHNTFQRQLIFRDAYVGLKPPFKKEDATAMTDAVHCSFIDDKKAEAAPKERTLIIRPQISRSPRSVSAFTWVTLVQPDGTVIYRQKLWGRFSQPLMLRDFPFDQQQLSVHMVAAGLSEQHVKMVPLVNEAGRSSSITDQFSLPDFNVVSWEALPAPYFPMKDEIGVAGYEMKVNVNRQPTYYILKVIIPLCLIVIMSWLPRWIDPEQSGTNIGISTSAFLTLVAYLFAITVLLPRVSYVTRLDRFILLSTLTVFAGLIQSVANTVWVKKQKQRLADRADRWSRVVYPALLVLILAISFVF